MPNTNANPEPPLVDVKVTNPLTYIKRWWARIIGNEGMEFRFRIRPLTAIAVAVVFASIAFGVGRFVLPFTIPFFKYNNPEPLPTIDPWRETAFTGTLQFSDSTKRYYLLTTSSEAITLEVPTNIDLKDLVGKRIFAAGKYNKSTRILVVTDTKNLEILPKTPIPLPTLTPISSPSLTPSATPESTLTPSATP